MAAGYGSDLWTCRRVASLLGKTQGVWYDFNHVGRIPHALGFGVHKPAPRIARARERGERAVERWRKRGWPRIKKRAASERHRRFLRRIRVHAPPAGASILGPARRHADRPPLGSARPSQLMGGIVVPSSARRTRPRAAQQHRLSAVFRIHTSNTKTPEATGFLRVLDRHVRGAMIVVQDRLNVHKAGVKRRLAGRPKGAPRVMVEWLPPYAPELNPAEQLWDHGKRVDLANLAPADRDDLRGHARRSLIRQRRRPNPLAAAFDHAGLPL